MNKRKFTTAAVFTLLTTALIATALSPVVAAELQHKADEKATEQAQANKDAFKVSEDALMTMRNVGGARLALFNGTPDRAQIYADAAVTRAGATLRDADKFAVDIKQPETDAEKYIPYNSSLSVAESFIPTEKNLKHITKANGQMHKGETENAVETLRVNGIDVSLTTEFLPIMSAKTQIENAARLIGDGKYYQANLVLKNVEDSVITKVVDYGAVPKDSGKS